MKRMHRMIAALAVCASAALLSGCAADPDLSALEGRLAEVEGVDGAWVDVQHPGAPWNTSVVVWMFIDDGSPEGIVAATRAAAPVFASDADASRHTVQISFVEGQADAYDERVDVYVDQVAITPEAYRQLGVPDTGRTTLVLRPAEMAGLADSR